MAFNGIFEFIDTLQKILGEAFEKGWFYILIIVGFFALLLTVVIVIIYVLSNQDISPSEIPKEKQEVINNALSFCNNRTFNSWEWVNESSYKFRCINKEIKNNSLENFYIS